jgi:hypothetical protein
MCLPIIAGIVSAVGTGISAVQQYQAGRAQAAALDRQALMEGQRGAYEAQRQRGINDRRIASMQGQYLSSGIALTGSPMDVLDDSATEASLDEQAIRYGAKVRSDNLRFEGSMARMNANQALVGGAFGAAGDVFGGIMSQRSYNQNRTMIRNPYEF